MARSTVCVTSMRVSSSAGFIGAVCESSVTVTVRSSCGTSSVFSLALASAGESPPMSMPCTETPGATSPRIIRPRITPIVSSATTPTTISWRVRALVRPRRCVARYTVRGPGPEPGVGGVRAGVGGAISTDSP